MDRVVLKADKLKVGIGTRGGFIDAVRGIELELHRGEAVALVGESGCGKSLTALSLAGLLPHNVQVTGGRIALHQQDVTNFSEAEWRAIRGKRIAMIFQDPMSALNPVLTIGEQVTEAILAHRNLPKREAFDEAVHLLERVRLREPAQCMKAYPHQLSGGMRQRVVIAMAVANSPDVLIADEPTTALDASVQGDILTLLDELRRETGMALLLITHDLSLVSKWADRAVVMYAGSIVEMGVARSLFSQPAHPYTRALLQSRPSRRPAGAPRQRLPEIRGRVPSPSEIGPGCSFVDRCELAMPKCREAGPLPLIQVPQGKVWCHATQERQHRLKVVKA